jgi:hypothetical protein
MAAGRHALYATCNPVLEAVTRSDRTGRDGQMASWLLVGGGGGSELQMQRSTAAARSIMRPVSTRGNPSCDFPVPGMSYWSRGAIFGCLDVTCHCTDYSKEDQLAFVLIHLL